MDARIQVLTLSFFESEKGVVVLDCLLQESVAKPEAMHKAKIKGRHLRVKTGGFHANY